MNNDNEVRNYSGEENNYELGNNKKLSELDVLPDDIDKSIITYFPFEDPNLTEKESMIHNVQDSNESSYENYGSNIEFNDFNNIFNLEPTVEEESETKEEFVKIEESSNDEIKELSNLFNEENNYFDINYIPNEEDELKNNNDIDSTGNSNDLVEESIIFPEKNYGSEKIIFPEKFDTNNEKSNGIKSYIENDSYENYSEINNDLNLQYSFNVENNNEKEDFEDTAKFGVINNEDNQKEENKFKLNKKTIIIISSILLVIILLVVVFKFILAENKVVTCVYEAEDTGYKVYDQYIITFEKGNITYIEGTYKYEAKTEEFYGQISAVKQKKLPVIVNSNGLSGFTYNFENTNTTISVYSYIDYAKIDFARLKNINQEVAPVAYFKIDKKDNKENLEENLKKEGYICNTK